MPLMTRRWSAHGLPRPPFAGSSGSNSAHARSVNSPRPTTPWPPALDRKRVGYPRRSRITRHALVLGVDTDRGAGGGGDGGGECDGEGADTVFTGRGRCAVAQNGVVEEADGPGVEVFV